jgi:hypothetical protein
MLHSECEAFDYLRLSPGACYEPAGRSGTEAAWYVLRGPLDLIPAAGPPRTLVEGDLLLAPDGDGVRLHSGRLGAEVLCLSLLPEPLSMWLPARKPDLMVHQLLKGSTR